MYDSYNKNAQYHVAGVVIKEVSRDIILEQIVAD